VSKSKKRKSKNSKPSKSRSLFPPPRDLKRRPSFNVPTCCFCEQLFDDVAVIKTDDHVVPRGFFNDTPPPNLPTWPVCRRCQTDLHDPEDRLRNQFAAAHSHHPQLLVEVYDRASRSTQPPIVHGRKLVATPSGLMVPASITIPRQDDLDIVFRKIAKGLYWWREHKLPKDQRYVVRQMNAADFKTWADFLLPLCGPQHLGEEFWWSTAYDATDPTWCIWLFIIHGAVPVGVWHGNVVDVPNIPAPAGIAMRE
jgi:hypothetical protein